MTLRAIIFDVDGTLADTESLHRLAFNRAFREAGFAWEWDERTYDQLLQVEGGLARIRAWVETHRPRDLANLEQDGTLAAMHAAKSDYYLRLLENEAPPLRPGVGRLIREARAWGVKLGVCTSSSRTNFEGVILNGLGFEALDWFEAVVTSADVTRPKPDPEGYLAACRLLGVDPSEAVAIEDNPRGAAAAAAAGMHVIACPGRGVPMAPVAGAMLTVSDLGEPGAAFDVIAGDAGSYGQVGVEALRVWTGEKADAAA